MKVVLEPSLDVQMQIQVLNPFDELVNINLIESGAKVEGHHNGSVGGFPSVEACSYVIIYLAKSSGGGMALAKAILMFSMAEAFEDKRQHGSL